MIFNAVELSRPLVGSSQRRRLGSVISSYPILVLFLSPPEIPLTRTPPIRVSLQSRRPSLSMTSLTLFSIDYGLRLVRNLAANLNDSSGVKVSRRTSSC